MKFYCLFLLLCTSALFAEPSQKSIGYVAIKPAYFFPQDSTFKHLYKGGCAALGEIGFYCSSKFFFSLEGAYFHKKKEIQSFDIASRSSITQGPLSLTAGYIHSLYCFWDIYGKIGPNGIYTKTKISIPNIPSEKTKYTPGFTVAAGTKFYFKYGLFTEVFCNYLYNRKKIHDNRDSFVVYLGGVQLGASLGFRY